MDEAVFKEEGALGLVGCVGVGVVKRLHSSNSCGCSALSGSQELLLGSFLCWQRCRVAKSRKKGLLAPAHWEQGCGPRLAALETFLSSVVVLGAGGCTRAPVHLGRRQSASWT